ncbi:MarR family transcriptional regulator [Streptomyces sp. NPDC001843]|uniref:MarR family transcriptional regulator n=1 Tax=Streptomyces sp. NPDC001843 TaxID=3364617 RepID=UPI0036B4EB15
MIASVGNAAALAFESALAAEDLHPRHFAVLRGLRDGEEHAQQQLASSLGIPARRLVGLLTVLIERGLVERRAIGHSKGATVPVKGGDARLDLKRA